MIYRVICTVIKATGTQSWLVDANSEEEAIQKFHDDDCSFEQEEIEVIEHGKPNASIADDVTSLPPVKGE